MLAEPLDGGGREVPSQHVAVGGEDDGRTGFGHGMLRFGMAQDPEW